jgi:threonine dehydrogenase-like Zn-dependent dehydrogenase
MTGRDNLCTSWRLLGMDSEQGAFAEYVAVAASNLYPIGPDVPAERAVMVEPLANSVHVMGIAGAGRFQTMAIFGAGAQGILALMLARHLGHRQIAVVETNPERRALAAELGAALCLDPAATRVPEAIRAWSDDGVDIAIEAVGLGVTRQAAVASVRKGGRVILLGLHDQVSEMDFATAVRNEVEMLGSFAYTGDDFRRSLALLTSGEMDPSPWVRMRPLDEGQAAFLQMLDAPGAILKTALTPA